MPTNENLCIRGCTIVCICALYMDTFETSLHISLECPFDVVLWKSLGDKLHISIDLSTYASALSCIPDRSSTHVRDAILVGIIHTFHTIWIACNLIRFQDAKNFIHAARGKIVTMVSMSGNYSNGHYLPIPFDTGVLDDFFVSS